MTSVSGRVLKKLLALAKNFQVFTAFSLFFAGKAKLIQVL
jgi:hypothetical protein